MTISVRTKSVMATTARAAIMPKWITRRRGVVGHPDFSIVADQHLETVYRFLLHMTSDHHLAEELTGQTFEKAWRHWSHYDPGRSQPQTWLCHMARNLTIDHWRKQVRSREELWSSPPESVDLVKEEGFDDGFAPPLAAALFRLSSEQRQLLALRVVLDFSTNETAAVMNISETTCSSQLHRALTKLRQEMCSDV